MSRLAQSTLTYYLYSSFINGSLVFSYLSTPGRQCACLVPRPRGGAGVRVCLHRPCTPRVGNLYSVTRTSESPGVRATECKALAAQKVLLGLILLLFTAPFPAEQCACLSVYLHGSVAEGAVGVRVSDPVTPRMSWGTPHGRTVAPKMIKLRRSSTFPVIVFTVLVVLRVGFSSGRLGSVGFRLGSVGFRFRRFGVEKET